MNYGLYLAAAGTLADLHRQDVITNNLANVNTVGFKPDLVFGRQRLPERLESGGAIEPQLLLEQLGGAQAVAPTRMSTTQGALTRTGSDFDAALDGEGFFVVGKPGSGPGRTFLTRDGRMVANARGELIMATTGLHVLDVNDRPIRLDRTAQVQINRNGDVLQNGKPVATIRIAVPADPTRLAKAGGNLLRLDAGSGALRPAGARLVQGHVEASAVDPIKTLNDLVKTSKSVASNAKMMQYQDHLMDQAVNTLGRVA